MCFRLSCYRPVSIEPIGAAIKGSRRIMISDLVLQGLKLFGTDIGWVCDNYMECTGNFFEPVGPDGFETRGKPVFQGIAAGGSKCIGGNVDAYCGGLRHLGE